MATITKGNRKQNVGLVIETIEPSDVFSLQSTDGSVKGVTKDILFAEISGLVGGGGAGSGEEIDMGDRMTGSEVLDCGSRI